MGGGKSNFDGLTQKGRWGVYKGSNPGVVPGSGGAPADSFLDKDGNWNIPDGTYKPTFYGVIFVDLVGGDDGKAKEQDRNKPYKILQTAIDRADDLMGQWWVIVVNQGDFSGEDGNIKQGVTLLAERFIPCPSVKPAIETWTAVEIADRRVEIDAFAGATRLYLGDITIDAGHDTETWIGGFNCKSITINQDTLDGFGRSRHHYQDIIVDGEIKAGVGITDIGGHWLRVHVVSTTGTFLDMDSVVGATIGGSYDNCSSGALGLNWSADVIIAGFFECLGEFAVGVGNSFDGTGYRLVTQAQFSFGGNAGTLIGTLSECFFDNNAIDGAIAPGSILRCRIRLSILSNGGILTGNIWRTEIGVSCGFVDGFVEACDFLSCTGISQLRNGAFIWNCRIALTQDSRIGAGQNSGRIGWSQINQASGTAAGNSPVAVKFSSGANRARIHNTTIIAGGSTFAVAGAAANQFMVAYNVTTNLISGGGADGFDLTNFSAEEGGNRQGLPNLAA